MKDYDEVARRLEGGEPLAAIARSFGVCRETLLLRMRSLGMRSSRFIPRTPDGLNLREDAVVRLRLQGLSHGDIAERFGYKSARVVTVVCAKAKKKLRRARGTDVHVDQRH